jgi:hypothetical protein
MSRGIAAIPGTTDRTATSVETGRVALKPMCFGQPLIRSGNRPWYFPPYETENLLRDEMGTCFNVFYNKGVAPRTEQPQSAELAFPEVILAYHSGQSESGGDDPSCNLPGNAQPFD